MTFPSILLQAQYFNLLDRQVRHFEIRQITRDPAARTQAHDRYATAAREIATALSEFAADTQADPRLARHQHEARILAVRIRATLAEPYCQVGMTVLTNVIGAFVVEPNRSIAA